ncbi:unnamed protein product [Linum tenue]|uniref:Uncharacterized protein n=1 Tax=Linum tenue TaxID=586396 RepID=A0AAV0IND0_9ROSI|nr:unnamed protein product [Linum tenue]
MGNCQAVDAATLVIQHPTGKVEKLYWPITAAEVMKTNPGHYVALLLSTTLYPPTSSSATNATKSAGGSGGPVRLTRIKLLRPTDTLTLGHVYRLITNQEVMKGLLAKKQAKLNQNNPQSAEDQQSASKSEDRRKQSSSVLPTTISETDESRRRRRSHGGSHPVIILQPIILKPKKDQIFWAKDCCFCLMLSSLLSLCLCLSLFHFWVTFF